MEVKTQLMRQAAKRRAVGSEVTVTHTPQVESLERGLKLCLGSAPRDEDLWLLDLEAF